ncbi:MAG: hypothetical protein K2X62_08950, partial [Beijerinckiaceae bacterium]|nr:hypothetical protein [Beijerinckiaceae bacterium]
MSEPAAKSRHPELRPAIDLDDFERRLRDQPVGTEPNHDPLAELARLVNGEADPFRNVFAESPAGHTRTPYLRPVEPAAPDPQAPSYDPHFDTRLGRLPPESTYDDAQYVPAAYAGQAAAYDQSAQYGQQHYAQDPQSYAAAGYGEPRYDERDYQHGSAAYQPAGRDDPDAPWLDPVMMAPPPHDLSEDYRPRRSRRAMYLMSAALLIVAGGIAGTLTLRAKSNASGEMPTILALNGPVKVQPVQTLSDAPKLGVSILERGSSNIADSKVVESQEQALDLAQAARSARAAAPASAPSRPDNGEPVTLAPPPPPSAATNSIFAEPKRVKSVTVRPDGTIVQNAAPAPTPRPDSMGALMAASGAVPASQTPTTPKLGVSSPNVTGSVPSRSGTRVASAPSQGLADAGAILQIPPPPQTIPPTVPRAPQAAAPQRQVASLAPAAPAAAAPR